MENERIRRRYCEGIQIRQEPDKPTEIVGYAALFNVLSVDLGGFREELLPGSFSDVLASEPDVQALVNHNRDFRLARSTAGTLKLTEDGKGLAVSIKVPDTQVGKDTLADIQNGNLSGFSFAFVVGEEDAIYQDDGDLYRVKKIAELFDVSVVDRPAYPQTSETIGLRDQRRNAYRLQQLLRKIENKEELTESERKEAYRFIGKLSEATIKTPNLDRFRALREKLEKM